MEDAPMSVRIPWTKVKTSRVLVEIHLVLLIPTAVNSNAVSFLLNIYNKLWFTSFIFNYLGNAEIESIFVEFCKFVRY